MMGWKQESPRLVDVLPELAAEVAEGLRRLGREELAGQVETLRLLSRCRCEDEFCATVHVAPVPPRLWQSPLESVPLSPKVGWLVVDVKDGSIGLIEVLDRPEIRKALLERFP